MSGPPFGDRMLSPQLISYLGRKEGKGHCLWPKIQEVDQVADDIKKVPCKADWNMWFRECRVDSLTFHLTALAWKESIVIQVALPNS